MQSSEKNCLRIPYGPDKLQTKRRKKPCPVKDTAFAVYTAYPFTPAEAMPWMMYFWKKRKIRNGGMTAIVASANTLG